jgi:hypothetical protein
VLRKAEELCSRYQRKDRSYVFNGAGDKDEDRSYIEITDIGYDSRWADQSFVIRVGVVCRCRLR